jgi:predicted membrane-bound dolichyl-phosphate-mannose-protein mannosyltransferase
MWFVLSISRGRYGFESDMIASKTIILMTNTAQILRKVLYNLTRTQSNTTKLFWSFLCITLLFAVTFYALGFSSFLRSASEMHRVRVRLTYKM